MRKLRYYMMVMCLMATTIGVSGAFCYVAGYQASKEVYLKKLNWQIDQTEYWRGEAWKMYNSMDPYFYRWAK